MKAYIKSDAMEDPEVIKDIFNKLSSQNVLPILTEKKWHDIISSEPFLYFRNPYVRFNGEAQILKFHHANTEIPMLASHDGEVLSVSRMAKGQVNNSNNIDFFPLSASVNTYYYEPKQEPLPILLVAGERSKYLELTLNSLSANLNYNNQKIYIVANNPGDKSMEIIKEFIKKTTIESHVVETGNNLFYSCINFGSKFFNIDKFIIWEDDAIAPECLHYLIPNWTKQLAYRATTADIATFRVHEGNWSPRFYRCGVSPFINGVVDIPNNLDSLWFYHHQQKNDKRLLAFGGMGMCVNGKEYLKNYEPPMYATSDAHFHKNKSSICIANVPIYHIGANQNMDYQEYGNNKHIDMKELNRYQIGTNLKTGERKEIDMQISFEEYRSLASS